MDFLLVFAENKRKSYQISEHYVRNPDIEIFVGLFIFHPEMMKNKKRMSYGGGMLGTPMMNMPTMKLMISLM